MDNYENLDLDEDIRNEEDLVQDGKNTSGNVGKAPPDDLKIPNFDDELDGVGDNDIDDERHGDHTEDDDYDDQALTNLLDI